jgi:glycyl-tRNA synthetase beta chain
MVQEFTELQGVVGGLYAQVQGEPDEVWQAIYDHYKPLTVSLQEECPRSVVGAVVSLADKLDAVLAGFSVGLEPTGSSDPFGLRRAGNGIVKIAVEVLPGLDVLKLAGTLAEMNLGLPRAGDPVGQVSKFLKERTEYFLHAVQGLRYDTVRAVVHSARGWSPPKEALQRGSALEQVRDTDDFRVLATAAKRTQNILSKSARQEDFGGQTGVDESLLLTPEERDLYDAYRQTRESLRGFEAASDYGGAILELARLRPLVDRFFDKVMVMDENRTLRANRLRLLAELSALAFTRFADLSEIESAGTEGGETRKG